MSPAAPGLFRVVVLVIVIVAAVLTLAGVGGAGAAPGVAVAPAGSITFVSTRPACLRPLLGTLTTAPGAEGTRRPRRRRKRALAGSRPTSVTRSRLTGSSGFCLETPTQPGTFQTATPTFRTRRTVSRLRPHRRMTLIRTTTTRWGTPLKGSDVPPFRPCSSRPWVPQAPPSQPVRTRTRRSHTTGRASALQTDETPDAGVDVDGQMYVTFTTNNPNTDCANCQGALGASYTSVMGRLDDPAQHPSNLDFTGLYTLSGPPPARSRARVEHRALEHEGHCSGSQVGSRTTGWPPRPMATSILGCARRRTNASKTGCTHGLDAMRATQRRLPCPHPGRDDRDANDGRPTAIQYYDGTSFARAGSAESVATPLFSDTPHPCVGELGVEYDPAIAAG